ncbi:MAG: hypothetical protein LBK73_03830 [Treponema sp.]|nr:hypothetical protein [Treponema sp.]
MSQLGAKTVVAKYFVCSPEDMTVVNVGTTTTINWPYYGTNASFFGGGVYVRVPHQGRLPGQDGRGYQYGRR